MKKFLPAPNEKVTISLSAADLGLIEKIQKMTGAYTKSEVVRDALRARYASLSTTERERT